MRSIKDDRTARAVIRDEALALFAAHGPDAVSVRQIATAAGVSAALVVHHFGSKEGLRDVVDRHVLETFDGMLTEMTGEGAPDLYDPAATGSLVEAVLQHLPADSPMPAYLRRMLLTDSEAGKELFAKLFAVSQGMLAALSEAGMAAPGADPAVRAAFLMANDLAVLLLRDRLTEVLGVDPLSQEGMARWASEMLAVYASGLQADPQLPEAGGAS
ncbi:transcriptional regulator, TetR family [Catenulispora acidiphila DSM 44928]|uniref:Transcriptional regulator, TetR family n=1 Tax=Catenulispora acidiphila (strain DSM 44928 / JCM 14897 / NBRC 102108 / NRRL B-24433 / ID139908) TaxID=479433 RepID=C7QAH3_CATAD|nr:TetR/AcrR family transcriptional regulator [Catenulispora acidiphila]ACU72472.1 transcriptional regulator, TetR family [Catenulispora acidiphila DSM 44928]